jgi:hypothetical protein
LKGIKLYKLINYQKDQSYAELIQNAVLLKEADTGLIRTEYDFWRNNDGVYFRQRLSDLPNIQKGDYLMMVVEQVARVNADEELIPRKKVIDFVEAEEDFGFDEVFLGEDDWEITSERIGTRTFEVEVHNLDEIPHWFRVFQIL